MEENRRTIQIFIANELNNKSALEISEVSMHADGPSNIQCTCKDYKKIEICKHVNYVIRKIEENEGSFGLYVPENVPDEIAYLAFSDAESSRNFILHYGKIEVM
jgi:hypothetical protein